jgi:hypothetical protein
MGEASVQDQMYGVLHLLLVFWRSTYIIRNKNGCPKTKPRAEALKVELPILFLTHLTGRPDRDAERSYSRLTTKFWTTQPQASFCSFSVIVARGHVMSRWSFSGDSIVHWLG